MLQEPGDKHYILLMQIKQGSQTALEQLFLQLKDTVFTLSLNYLRNREEAEEVVQDVFVEVFQSADTFKGEASVKTWVCRIAVNKSLNLLKYRGRKKRFAFISSLFGESGELRFNPADFDHPGIALENKEKASYLFAAVDKLPENQKTAFLLLKVQGLSQKEAAEVMAIGEKALESLYQRARANLKKDLENIYDQLF